MPNEIFTINLNAQAIIPEAFILLGIVGTLLVDLAGEKTASKWAPIICYLSIGGSLVSLALQWSNPVESAFLCLLYTSPSPRDATLSRMPSSA